MSTEDLIDASVDRARRKLRLAQDHLDVMADAILSLQEDHLSPEHQGFLTDVTVVQSICIESLVSSARGWLIVATELSDQPEPEIS